tara:strand:+ start:187 stop:357 length:171 start_codon:yes stop_codon:yes gene_type:complete
MDKSKIGGKNNFIYLGTIPNKNTPEYGVSVDLFGLIGQLTNHFPIEGHNLLGNSKI